MVRSTVFISEGRSLPGPGNAALLRGTGMEEEEEEEEEAGEEAEAEAGTESGGAPLSAASSAAWRVAMLL